MKKPAFMFFALGCVVVLGSGCALIRAFINTQPKVAFSEEDYWSPETIVGGPVLVYVPGPADLAGVNTHDAALLQRFAPVIVQGVLKTERTSFDRTFDYIGLPSLERGADGLRVAMDTASPTLFARVEKAGVHNRTLTQLVYMFWYPCRPEGGIQEGDVDGGVLRVTLDAAMRPMVYEYAQSCGCYHGAFVAEHVEQWAADEFTVKLRGKRFFVEKDPERLIAWEVRDLVRSTDSSSRPLLFIKSGVHMLAALQTSGVMAQWPALDQRAYRLQQYDALVNLPVKGETGAASMFNSDGLVWGAGRSGEELLFSDLDHPGWPRHLDKMKIHWDEADWIDPALLMKFLRLPSCVTDPHAPLPATGQR